MTIELAQRRLVSKPWGSRDLAPWDDGSDDCGRIGEIWYDRPDGAGNTSTLLLKLLFTTEPLSIQVHPDDKYAQSMGMERGKTEAWYILSATPGAQVALGLKRSLTAAQLRQAATNGSLANLIKWRSVWAGDTIFVPAGTIHTIGAGLIIAEIQQRSDTTFRLFDPGRDRELHIDRAVDVALADLAPEQQRPRHVDGERTLLLSDPHFVIERLNLLAGQEKLIEAQDETWLLVVAGSGRAGAFEVGQGSALFASSDRVSMSAGADGLVCLIAHAGRERPAARLPRGVTQADAKDEARTPLPMSPSVVIQAEKSTVSVLVKETQ